MASSNSRNTTRGEGWVGGPPAWWTDGAWCEQLDDDSPAGRGALRHHYHCEGCGACLPESAEFAGRDYGVRADTRYCSGACRQRAYRQRKSDDIRA
jgi:hypothetical protein